MPSWCSTVAWKQTPSLPDARLRADVFRRGDRESKFLAVGTGYGTGAPAYDVFGVKFFCYRSSSSPSFGSVAFGRWEGNSVWGDDDEAFAIERADGLLERLFAHAQSLANCIRRTGVMIRQVPAGTLQCCEDFL